MRDVANAFSPDDLLQQMFMGDIKKLPKLSVVKDNLHLLSKQKENAINFQLISRPCDGQCYLKERAPIEMTLD